MYYTKLSFLLPIVAVILLEGAAVASETKKRKVDVVGAALVEEPQAAVVPRVETLIEKDVNEIPNRHPTNVDKASYRQD